jgi:hypothetical protein
LRTRWSKYRSVTIAAVNGVVITLPIVLATTAENAFTASLPSDSTDGTISRMPCRIPPRNETRSTPTSSVTQTFHQRPRTSRKERRSAPKADVRSNSSAGMASDQATESQMPGMISAMNASISATTITIPNQTSAGRRRSANPSDRRAVGSLPR